MDTPFSPLPCTILRPVLDGPRCSWTRYVLMAGRWQLVDREPDWNARGLFDRAVRDHIDRLKEVPKGSLTAATIYLAMPPDPDVIPDCVNSVVLQPENGNWENDPSSAEKAIRTLLGLSKTFPSLPLSEQHSFALRSGEEVIP